MRRLLVCSFAWIRLAGQMAGAPADSALEYSATVTPARAVAGQNVILSVMCRATRRAAQGISLYDESLTIELTRGADAAEPRYAFPNRKTIEDGDLLIREGQHAPPLNLRAGERRERSFELNALFPLKLLAAGDYRIGFSLRDGQRWIRSKQAALRLRPDPEQCYSYRNSGEAETR